MNANVRAGRLLTASRYIPDDNLSSQLDGILLIFTLSNNYVTGTVSLELNGVGLIKDEDYEETGSNQVTFLLIAPESTEKLVASYIKS